MKKFLPIFAVPLLALAILSTMSFGGFWNRAVITWSPPKIEEEQFPGTAKVLTAKFTSKKDLENVKLWLTPPLKRYAVVEPETIDEVKKNQEYTIQIIISLPSDILSKNYSEKHLDSDIKGLDKDLKEYLGKHKDLKEYLRNLKRRIPGLLFVTSEKSVPWFKLRPKTNERKIRVVHPKALMIMIKVKEPTAEDVLEEPFIKDTDLDKVVTAEEEEFPVNEIVIVMREETKLLDVLEIIEPVGGVIIGFIPEPQVYKVEVPANTAEELNNFINIIKGQQNPLVLFIAKNFIGSRY